MRGGTKAARRVASFLREWKRVQGHQCGYIGPNNQGSRETGMEGHTQREGARRRRGQTVMVSAYWRIFFPGDDT